MIAARGDGTWIVIAALLTVCAPARADGQAALVHVDGPATYLEGEISGPRCAERGGLRWCVYEAWMRLRTGEGTRIRLGGEPRSERGDEHTPFVSFDPPHERSREWRRGTPNEDLVVRMRFMAPRRHRATVTLRPSARYLLFSGLLFDDVDPPRASSRARKALLECAQCTVEGPTDLDLDVAPRERLRVGGASPSGPRADTDDGWVDGSVDALPTTLEIVDPGRRRSLEPVAFGGLSIAGGGASNTDEVTFWGRAGIAIMFYGHLALIPSVETDFDTYVGESLMVEATTPVFTMGESFHFAAGVVFHQGGARNLEACLRARISMQLFGFVGWMLAIEHWPVSDSFAMRFGALLTL